MPANGFAFEFEIMTETANLDKPILIQCFQIRTFRRYSRTENHWEKYLNWGKIP